MKMFLTAMVRHAKKYGRVYATAAAASTLWITVHLASVHTYAVYCAPMTMQGIFRTVFLVPSPGCQVLRYGILYGGDHITYMWTSLLTFIATSVAAHGWYAARGVAPAVVVDDDDDN